MIHRFKSIIFDLFGTLIPNWSISQYDEVVGRIAGTLGVDQEILDRLLTERREENMNGAYRRLEDFYLQVYEFVGVPSDPDRATAAARHWFEFSRKFMTAPRADAVNTINELKRQSLKLGLITNCGVEVPAIWPQTAFGRIIEDPVFSFEAGMTKPDPRIYLLACERLGVPAQECVYVGDGMSKELSGAAAVGMTAVKIHVPGDAFAEAQQWDGPTIQALGEVLAIIR